MKSFSHAYALLREAVRQLATSSDPIQKRLIRATMELYVLPEEAFANHPDLLVDLEGLKQGLPAIDTSSREQIAAAFSMLTDNESERLARAVFDFYLDVAQIYHHENSAYPRG